MRFATCNKTIPNSNYSLEIVDSISPVRLTTISSLLHPIVNFVATPVLSFLNWHYPLQELILKGRITPNIFTFSTIERNLLTM
jgi:hypothetical protein